MRKTKADPGGKPFWTKAAAMGMEPVAQTYMGTAANRTAKYGKPLELILFMSELGTKISMAAPMRIPAIIHFLVSAMRVPNP